jgi:hypothetical protein
MANVSDGVSQHAAENVVLNEKLGYDAAAQLQHQSQNDNQEDARAWAQLKLRVAQNAATVDHFLNITSAAATATAQQTGQTAETQTVSPVRTGTGDAIVGGVGVSAEQIAANVANLATSITPIIVSSLATAISEALAAILPIVVTASGGASTPSQTKSPTAG